MNNTFKSTERKKNHTCKTWIWYEAKNTLKCETKALKINGAKEFKPNSSGWWKWGRWRPGSMGRLLVLRVIILKYLLLFFFISFKVTIFSKNNTVYYGCSNAYDSGIKERARCHAEACTEEVCLLPPSMRDVLTLVRVGKTFVQLITFISKLRSFIF